MDFSKHNDRITVEFSGIKYGSIVYFKVFKDYAVEQGEPIYTITIKRRMEVDTSLDTIDFFKSSGMDIYITNLGVKANYVGHKIVSITEELEDDKLVYQTIVTRGTKRNVEYV